MFTTKCAKDPTRFIPSHVIHSIGYLRRSNKLTPHELATSQKRNRGRKKPHSPQRQTSLISCISRVLLNHVSPISSPNLIHIMATQTHSKTSWSFSISPEVRTILNLQCTTTRDAKYHLEHQEGTTKASRTSGIVLRTGTG